jgi:lipoate-protein ligase A
LKYTKKQLLKYKGFLAYNEVLKTVLDEGVEYTIEEVKDLLDTYFGKKRVSKVEKTEETPKKKIKSKNEVND